LRVVLKNIRTAGLEVDKPAVLRHFTRFEFFANNIIRLSGICCIISFPI
jgi:hypothetical protein